MPSHDTELLSRMPLFKDVDLWSVRPLLERCEEAEHPTGAVLISPKANNKHVFVLLKGRPTGNRMPEPNEAANCREYLDGQLSTIDPDYIVCWGSVAAQNLLASNFPIGKMRGKFYLHNRAKVLCTYHPSYLLRNPAAKKDVWEDMKFMMRDMGVKVE